MGTAFQTYKRPELLQPPCTANNWQERGRLGGLLEKGVKHPQDSMQRTPIRYKHITKTSLGQVSLMDIDAPPDDISVGLACSKQYSPALQLQVCELIRGVHNLYSLI